MNNKRYSLNRRLLLKLFTLFLVVGLAAPTTVVAKEKFRVAWSIYVVWMPWGYADSTGIVKKWADKYDIEIEVVQINDYVESINQYTSGAFDTCVMTNMDALTIPAASGVDSTALIVGDFSNGNDAVILKGEKELKDIAGQKINLVELSVSHSLLARALESVGLAEKDVTVVNTSEAVLAVMACGRLCIADGPAPGWNHCRLLHWRPMTLHWNLRHIAPQRPMLLQKTEAW